MNEAFEEENMMKRELKLSLPDDSKDWEFLKQKPEEITLYAQGAGLYTYLSVLAERITAPRFDGRHFEIRQ